jgi:hypothetical protein
MNTQENISYKYDDKKKIVFRIQNLKSRKFYIKLFKIIIKENIDYNTNNNGIFFNINKLSNTQFDKINTYLDFCELSSYTESDSMLESESLSESIDF